MRIALTGATGFVGAECLKNLSGHAVIVLARKAPTPPLSNVVIGDLENSKALAELVAGADCVVHMAGAIAARNESEFFKINFAGTRRIFSAARDAGVKRFVYVSSLTARLPSISPYAGSKRAAEDFLLSQHDMETVILRPCAVYGPGDRATLPLLAALRQKIAFVPSHARSRFSLIHVSDLAVVIAAAVSSSKTGLYEIDDLEGGHTWAELAALCAAHTGLPQRTLYLPSVVAQAYALANEIWASFRGETSIVSSGKMRELYHDDWVVHGENWLRENPIPLAQGFPATLDWYQQEGWLPPLPTKAMSTS